MICILSQTTKKHKKLLSRPLHSKLKKIQGLPLNFKDFSRLCEPWIQFLSVSILAIRINRRLETEFQCLTTVLSLIAKQTDRAIIFGLQLMWRHVLAFQKEWTISQLSIMILILRENNRERESGKNTASSLFIFSSYKEWNKKNYGNET